MTQFIHLADSRKAARIARSGIKAATLRHGEAAGVYCTPVSMDYYRTHQWLRELKRRGVKTMLAVQFHLAPDIVVRIGRYNEDHIEVNASEAARIFHEHESGLGLEIIVQQRIPANAIQRIYLPKQVIGWRFRPEAKGKKPFCGCKFCNRGEINAYRVITES